MRRASGWLVPAVLIVLGALQVTGGVWIHAKAVLAQILLERAWQQTRDGGERVRPWPWADTWPVARLAAPRLDASWIVLAGAHGRTLAFGPGWTEGTSLPGERGTAVVNGHRDTHFAALRDLTWGDEIRVERPDGATLRYTVSHLDVFDSRHQGIPVSPDGRSLALVTCFPFHAITPGGPLRYVVTAVYTPDEDLEAPSPRRVSTRAFRNVPQSL